MKEETYSTPQLDAEEVVTLLKDGPLEVEYHVFNAFEKYGLCKIISFEDRYNVWTNRREFGRPNGMGRLNMREMLHCTHFECGEDLICISSLGEDQRGNFARILYFEDPNGKSAEPFKRMLKNRPELYNEFVSEFLYMLSDKPNIMFGSGNTSGTLQIIQELLDIVDDDDSDELFDYYRQRAGTYIIISDLFAGRKWRKEHIEVMRDRLINYLEREISSSKDNTKINAACFNLLTRALPKGGPTDDSLMWLFYRLEHILEQNGNDEVKYFSKLSGESLRFLYNYYRKPAPCVPRQWEKCVYYYDKFYIYQMIGRHLNLKDIIQVASFKGMFEGCEHYNNEIGRRIANCISNMDIAK